MIQYLLRRRYYNINSNNLKKHARFRIKKTRCNKITQFESPRRISFHSFNGINAPRLSFDFSERVENNFNDMKLKTGNVDIRINEQMQKEVIPSYNRFCEIYSNFYVSTIKFQENLWQR